MYIGQVETGMDRMADGAGDETEPAVIIGAQSDGLFPGARTTGELMVVRVEKDGGADGSATTAASWTYTVRSVDKTKTLGREVALATPRPNGLRTFQAGADGFGLACYDQDGVLRLIEAYEIETTGGCT